MRGVNPFPEDVSSALTHLKAIDQRAKDFHAGSTDLAPSAKAQRIQNAQTEAHKVLYKDGSLVHRSESDLKTHTSYLVFAVLPREWSDEDEAREAKKWGGKVEVSSAESQVKSQRQLKKENKMRRRAKEVRAGGDEEQVVALNGTEQ